MDRNTRIIVGILILVVGIVASVVIKGALQEKGLLSILPIIAAYYGAKAVWKGKSNKKQGEDNAAK